MTEKATKIVEKCIMDSRTRSDRVEERRGKNKHHLQALYFIGLLCL